jgi:hypothetical protein
MSHKRKLFTSPGAIPAKTWRKSISTENKLHLINRLVKGECIANIRCGIGLAKSNAQRIRDNVDKTEEVLLQ